MNQVIGPINRTDWNALLMTKSNMEYMVNKLGEYSQDDLIVERLTFTRILQDYL